MYTTKPLFKLTGPKRKNVGERGIDCIFIEYVDHSKAYRFYTMKPNYSVSVHIVIESCDAVFDEMWFSSIIRPKDLIPSTSKVPNPGKLDDVVDPKKQEI